MKKQIKKKAAPKIEKVDLTPLELLSLFHSVMLIAFGLIISFTLIDVKDDAKRVRFSLNEINDNTFQSSYNLRKIDRYVEYMDDSLDSIERELKSKNKAAKK